MNGDQELELNAFVDGELSDEQRAEMLAAMQTDSALADAVRELGDLKSQVQQAYLDPPAGRSGGRRTRTFSWPAIAAGLALLALGSLGGWALHGSLGSGDRFVLLDNVGRAQAPAVADGDETRIVFHVTNPDQQVAGELLDEVEAMLALYDKERQPLRIEIVSHGEGLGLLRVRLSAHKARIGQLAARYTNLSFVACQNTIDRLRVEHGVEVRLVPEADITRSGVNHVVTRQQQGWSYIRV